MGPDDGRSIHPPLKRPDLDGMATGSGIPGPTIGRFRPAIPLVGTVFSLST
jgi:hypothetical protein